jgi:putative SOS response-associated peptidase YedK
MTDRTGKLPPPASFLISRRPLCATRRRGAKWRWRDGACHSPVFAPKGRNSDPGVTNVRYTASPHWRRWFSPEEPVRGAFTIFPNPSHSQTGVSRQYGSRRGQDRPLGFFAGIHVPGWKSVRKVKEGEVTAVLFAFLTCEPNALVRYLSPQSNAGNPHQT